MAGVSAGYVKSNSGTSNVKQSLPADYFFNNSYQIEKRKGNEEYKLLKETRLHSIFIQKCDFT